MTGAPADHEALRARIAELQAEITADQARLAEHRAELRQARAALRRRPEPPPGPQRHDGEILRVADGVIHGWARDLLDPDEAPWLEVYVDAGFLTDVRADRPREGSDRDDGFAVALPARYRDGRRHYLEISPAQGAISLPVAPTFDEDSPADELGTRFERMRRAPPPADLPRPRALVGRDGHLFLCDDGNNSVDQMTGRLGLSPPRLARQVSRLRDTAAALDAAGLPYVLAVAPAKEAVCTASLPPAHPQLGPPVARGQLLDALGDDGPELVDLHEPLRAAAAAGDCPYYAQDTHWNQHGVWIAARTLLAAARARGVPVPDLEADAVRWGTWTHALDLAKMEQVVIDGERLLPAGDAAIARIARGRERGPAPRITESWSQPVPPELQVSPTRDSIILEHPVDGPALHAVLYGDSFSRLLVPTLAQVFARTVFLWTPTVDAELMARHRPDVVFQVVAERFLTQPPA